MKNKFTSSGPHEGHIYGLDESILACVDAATGESEMEGRAGTDGQSCSRRHLIVLTEDGELALVRARLGRHDELVRIQAIDGKTWNHPVITDGRLLRQERREWRFRYSDQSLKFNVPGSAKS